MDPLYLNYFSCHASVPPAGGEDISVGVPAFVFLDELALLVVLVISGAAIDAPLVTRLALAVAPVAVASLVWGRWLAPRAPHPIAHPQSLGAKLVVFAVGAIAFSATGDIVGAIVFFVVSTALVVASEWERHRLAS